MASRTLFVLLLIIPAAASAQDARGASAGASVSATTLDSRTSWSVAGSFEYRVNRAAGFEIEATMVPRLKTEFPPFIIASSFTAYSVVSTQLTSLGLSPAPTVFPAPRFENARGRAVFLTNNVRVHIPTTIDRIDPYFVAGGGLANIRQSADYIFGLPVPTSVRIGPQPISSSSTSMALTLGGGVGIRAMSRTWIEADLRMFRLLGDDDRNAGRFGVGVRYRF